MTMHYLSRIRLRRDAPASALAPILLPDDPNARCSTAHRLLWTLFADGPERQRDFLWREAGRGPAAGQRAAFLVLSARAPVDHHGLLEVETSEFAPALAAGDRLAFSLRANPVVTRKDPATGRAQRHDIVMDRLKPLPQAERAAARGTAMADAGRAWLARQGEQHGFRLLDPAAVRVDGYDQIRIARGQGRKAIEISVLDLDGLLEVQSPDAFLPALCQGFGKAKAFGCGLMLIRRART